MSEIDIGKQMHDLAISLWPLNRSITGNGVRQTLQVIAKICPKLSIREIPSGTKVFDWTVPDEWNVEEAYLVDPNGIRIADFTKNNLHLVGYSISTDEVLDLSELQDHLYSLPELPDAIPYVTSYYQKRWGFCVSHETRTKLIAGKYRVHIRTTLKPGFLTLGELIIPGQTTDEVLLSTYICHPSLANNELSGPVVTTYLARWIESIQRRFTYRILFVPETIGSITYLSMHLDKLKRNVIAGFNISCVGDERQYSYLPSRSGTAISDLVAKHVLKWIDRDFQSYTWRDRGSDERQYCAPGIDLPIASIMRTKYGEYPEYHTSKDNLTEVVTPKGLAGGYLALRRALELLEANFYPVATVLCEPQLGRRGLYPTTRQLSSSGEAQLLLDILTFSDGKANLIEIADKCGVPAWDLVNPLRRLMEKDLIRRADISSGDRTGDD